MGIKKLITLLNENTVSAKSEKHISDYRGKIIAIDISIYLYKFSSFCNSSIDNNSKVIESLKQQIYKFLKYNIIPLYVFDGKPPKEKYNELINRSNIKKENNEKRNFIKNLINSTTPITKDSTTNQTIYDKYISMNLEELKIELANIPESITITQELKQTVQDFLKFMGIPFIIAQGEAEYLCAKLCEYDYVYGCLSEDTDILVNGGKKFIRGYSNYSNKLEEYDLNKILIEMDITYKQFVDLCILCGCDYTGTIYGIGINNAYKLIKSEGNIENIIAKHCINKGNNMYHKKGYRFYSYNNGDTIPNIRNKNKKLSTFEYQKSRDLYLKYPDLTYLKNITNYIHLSKPDIDSLLLYKYISPDESKKLINLLQQCG